jgi:hypothetical protein
MLVEVGSTSDFVVDCHNLFSIHRALSRSLARFQVQHNSTSSSSELEALSLTRRASWLGRPDGPQGHPPTLAWRVVDRAGDESPDSGLPAYFFLCLWWCVWVVLCGQPVVVIGVLWWMMVPFWARNSVGIASLVVQRLPWAAKAE